MGKKKVENLTPMYGLFSKVNGLKILCAEFKSYVEVTVRDIVNDKDNDEQMVDKLLEFKVFTDTAITTSFADSLPTPTSHGVDLKGPKQVNQEFAYALIDAFQKGFRARRNKPAELIAKHLDRLMRRGQRSLSDDEFEAKLDDSLALYRFTDDKDVFRTFYHRALAKRLLLERSASDDFERAMLKKLKESKHAVSTLSSILTFSVIIEYDPEFDMGDQMFKDLALSRETMREFHSRIADDSSASKLTVMVLQRSAWPFVARQIDTDLPPSMQSDISSFSTFYKIKHQGHKLDWDHALGTATLKANFAAGTKELTVSLYQAAVLLLFNEETELGYREIHEHTRMDDAELRRTLQSLACGNKKVLTKVPPGRDVDDDDVFHFNPNFTDKLRRVHINTIQAKETPEESIRMQTHIEGDRKLYLDAAIVRIMKAKKELHFEQLKVLTIDAVKGHFIPDVPMVKQRIAGLVENEYLSRDPDDMNLYLYVA
ncbi:hypothetical protein SERLA73DRAFT_97075 [Serpula lacrymans var. lacrymans S7.3]|uniref:Cullin family profile domain-containing protein n=1 Tax=Serpula lacrymans var. lacrymans (strain S7.3) TaxID=936435 RepID=F8QC86_SERL3|nr:hypothetical protein SERLA73DRAFT_97075 [Serpula lacrymans var. lacrymans S7.3]